jgi:hypothetical protein
LCGATNEGNVYRTTLLDPRESRCHWDDAGGLSRSPGESQLFVDEIIHGRVVNTVYIAASDDFQDEFHTPCRLYTNNNNIFVFMVSLLITSGSSMLVDAYLHWVTIVLTISAENTVDMMSSALSQQQSSNGSVAVHPSNSTLPKSCGWRRAISQITSLMNPVDVELREDVWEIH